MGRIQEDDGRTRREGGIYMKKVYIIVYVLLILLLSSFASAYVFDYPYSYYYDKENIEVNKEFIEQFENYAPEYLRDRLEIEFTTDKSSNFLGYCYCHSFDGRIEITMYRDSWIDYNYEDTLNILNHELKHTYQCKLLKEYPHHEESFYEIII